MGNQQPKTTDIDTGWLAGMFDGEGSFGLYANNWIATKYGKQNSYTPRISVCNTSVVALERVVRILEENEIAFHVLWQRQNRRRPLWRVNIVGIKRGLRFLTLFLPYLTIKQEVASCVFAFCRSRLEGNREAVYSPDEAKLIARVYEINGSNGKRNNPLGSVSGTVQRLHAEHGFLGRKGIVQPLGD